MANGCVTVRRQGRQWAVVKLVTADRGEVLLEGGFFEREAAVTAGLVWAKDLGLAFAAGVR